MKVCIGVSGCEGMWRICMGVRVVEDMYGCEGSGGDG